MNRIKIIIITVFILISVSLKAQMNIADSIAKSSNYLKVYLDGIPEWQDYVRVKLWYADFVRDPALAQIQVIISTQPTASGGKLYHIFFIGRNSFNGRNDTLSCPSPLEYTKRQTRDELTNVITMGLMPYFSLNSQHKFFAFDYNDVLQKMQRSSDKWKFWVFTVGATPEFKKDEAGTSMAGSALLSASHVTDDWKFRVMTDAILDYEKFTTDTINFESTELIRHINFLAVRSINDHWSWGAEIGHYSSTFNNIQSQYYLAPGIEYDIFPYSESINHILAFKYRIKPLLNFYSDTTIYNKTQEFLLSHVLDATYTRIERWGNFSTTLTATQYLNHPDQFRFDVSGQMDFRLAQGLFLNLVGKYAYIQNQRSISNTGLSPEEIILQHNEMLTNYSYAVQIGITYTFGAIFNSIVNPRYESGITIDPEVADILGK
jgi:hypothetical protein